MAMISDWIMSLRKCEKLMAPRTLKRVASVSVAARVVTPMLLSIHVLKARTLLVRSSPVLRECGDETIRTLRLPARACDSLGRAGVRRRHRPHRIPRRDFAGA